MCRRVCLSVLLFTLLFNINKGIAQSIDSIKLAMIYTGAIDSVTIYNSTDTNQALTFNPDAIDYSSRKKWVIGSHVLAYGGSLALLNQMWYANDPRSSFHFFNDNFEWNQMDKVGHSWSAYQLSRVSYATWLWAGYSDKQSAWLSSASSAVLMTAIETLDGFSSKWGWSWGDFGANTFGSGLFLGQQLLWQKQIISFKYSFHKETYNDPAIDKRADQLFGSQLGERMLKDYNSQTYWLSANLKDIFKESKLPSWLNIAVGYGSKNMMGAGYNSWYDPEVDLEYHIIESHPRQRQWYLAPDIDFTKFKTNKKWLKTVFFALNAIKIPAPTLLLEGGKMKFKPIYF